MDEFELELQGLIDKALSQRKLWEERRSEAEHQIETLDSRLAAYQTTLKDYWESVDETGTSQPNLL
jgi:hypothetical protein